MLAPWLELPGVAEQLAELGEVAGLDLIRLGTTADADEIKDTAVTQPLIVALGRDRRGRARPRRGRRTSVVAGHSVGELTAAAVVRRAHAGRSAVAFAARRGAEMAAACALTPTGMSARARRRPGRGRGRASRRPGSPPANRNGAGQIVAAGALDGLAKLAEAPAGRRARSPARRGRRVPHPLHGAGRQTRSAPTPGDLEVADPRHILLSNADGASVTAGDDLVARLVAPGHPAGALGPLPADVRDLGVSAAIELAAGGHAHRHRQARAARRRAARRQDAGRPRRARAGSSTAARSTGRASTRPTSRSSSPPPRASSPAPRRSPRGSTSRAGRGWAPSRTNRDEHAIVTATGRRAHRVAASGRRHRRRRPAGRPPLQRIGDPRHHAVRRASSPARTPGSSASATTGRPTSSPTTTSSRAASTPTTSGSRAGSASPSGARPTRTRRSSTWPRTPAARRWPPPASTPPTSTSSSPPPARCRRRSRPPRRNSPTGSASTRPAPTT